MKKLDKSRLNFKTQEDFETWVESKVKDADIEALNAALMGVENQWEAILTRIDELNNELTDVMFIKRSAEGCLEILEDAIETLEEQEEE